MINGTSQNALRQILSKTLTDTLSSNFVSGVWEESEENEIHIVQLTEFYMVTISALSSRFIVLLHFSNNDESKKIVAEKINKSELDASDDEFYDYIAELSNIFAGRIKHELILSLPYTGMSVPRRMAVDTIRFINELSLNWDIHLKATISGIEIGASILVNAGDDVKILPPSEKAEDEMDCGVMELF